MQNYYKAYMREKQARDELEELLEEKTSKLYALNIELEKKIEILQRQQVAVVQSEKMATLGTLSAGVAHEINNPLAYLTCNLDTLAEYTDDINEYLSLSSKLINSEVDLSEFSSAIAKLQQNISIADLIQDINDITDDCKEGCGRISKIVANLLDFAKPTAESILEFEALEIIEQTTQLLENKLKQLHVTIDCEPELIITGNKPNLTQALINILVNAAQSCESKRSDDQSFSPMINIRARQEGENALIEIQDNGQGVDPQVINRVFDPFYSTKPLGEGTGMGLAVVYGIISNHLGTVSIDNNIDSGVTVSIKIPLVH
ncbi:sensor histidine kinase [Pseudoalteromonas umbrosa]|uniref:sensor histidine kinase n=1 Tax=Pseudoalteromonas umbrosa TaxID=3048489 RepID=UPI0024C3C833|nr:ATP-binding protein [Pseudoalteromonas sp. B95]MDK1288052.1 ATP-binding protein [Pseudoalteromonas sp. B95]